MPPQTSVADVIVQRHHPVQRRSYHRKCEKTAAVLLVFSPHDRYNSPSLHETAGGGVGVGVVIVTAGVVVVVVVAVVIVVVNVVCCLLFLSLLLMIFFRGCCGGCCVFFFV